jgi:hypothetical protein
MINEFEIQKYINALELAKQALKFYADENTYNRTELITPIDLDYYGHQARYALKTIDTILSVDQNALTDSLNQLEKVKNKLVDDDIEESIKNLHEELSLFKQQYDGLLNSGMFFEKYPQLTGEWEKDKSEFITLILNEK